MKLVAASDLEKDLDDIIWCGFEYPIQYVTGNMSLSDRFKLIEKNYNAYQSRVDAGVSSWMRGDPYMIADWMAIFSPIEHDAWCEIRAYGLPLWPQLPVGRFFVDFGNPVAKIALECDGKKFHDPEKDRMRDMELNSLGWRVFRVPGSRCFQTRVMDDPCHHDGDDQEKYMEQYKARTILPVILEMRDILQGYPR